MAILEILKRHLFQLQEMQKELPPATERNGITITLNIYREIVVDGIKVLRSLIEFLERKT